MGAQGGKSLTLYVAGKVGKNSKFGTHHWRDGFVSELATLSKLPLRHLDPLAYEQVDTYNPQQVFDKDCWLIDKADCVVVYLSDDISVGGSQEMLIAKYLGKPLIAYAPLGGKFNSPERESFGRIVKDYVDPFVFASCDAVCGSVEEVADALTNLPDMPKRMTIIDDAINRADVVMSSGNELKGI